MVVLMRDDGYGVLSFPSVHYTIVEKSESEARKIAEDLANNDPHLSGTYTSVSVIGVPGGHTLFDGRSYG